MPGTLLERVKANREKREHPQPPKIVSLYPTPIRKPEWVRRAAEGRLYGDDGAGKAFWGGDAA